MAHFHICQLLKMQTAIQQEVNDVKKALQQKTQDFDEAIEFFGNAIQDLRCVAQRYQQKNRDLLAELLEARQSVHDLTFLVMFYKKNLDTAKAEIASLAKTAENQVETTVAPLALNDAEHRLSQDDMSNEEITAIESQAKSVEDENMTQTQVDDAVVAIAMADTSIIQDEEVKASVENGSIEEPKENSVKSTCAVPISRTSKPKPSSKKLPTPIAAPATTHTKATTASSRSSLAKMTTSTAPQTKKSFVSKAPPASKSGQHQDLLRVQTSKTRLETAKPSRFNATVDATTASHSKNRIVVAEVAGIAKILPRQVPTCSPAKADIHETCHNASALTIHDPKPDNQQETKTTKRSAQTKTSHLEATAKCLSSNLVVAMPSRKVTKRSENFAAVNPRDGKIQDESQLQVQTNKMKIIPTGGSTLADDSAKSGLTFSSAGSAFMPNAGLTKQRRPKLYRSNARVEPSPRSSPCEPSNPKKSPTEPTRPQLRRSVSFTMKARPEERVQDEDLPCECKTTGRLKKPHQLKRSVALMVESEIPVVSADEQHEETPCGVASRSSTNDREPQDGFNTGRIVEQSPTTRIHDEMARKQNDSPDPPKLFFMREHSQDKKPRRTDKLGSILLRSALHEPSKQDSIQSTPPQTKRSVSFVKTASPDNAGHHQAQIHVQTNGKCMETPHQLNRSENFVVANPRDGPCQDESQLQVQTNKMKIIPAGGSTLADDSAKSALTFSSPGSIKPQLKRSNARVEQLPVHEMSACARSSHLALYRAKWESRIKHKAILSS
ncbi:hypothetical protein AeMF1_003734 [Aphanomyces euteiches]|nr:hypothetical protein AeMF1_003734 [Aphanomyces euteiches]KAH9189560.1 hypothetical protein AeNC1_008468 [Aphanomyces euteiches]